MPDPCLPVVETFHSLQGEGLHAGRSALFIRLGGCSVGCSWCDTKHSWPAAQHPSLPLSVLVQQTQAAAAAGAAFVVITGGEPLHHDLGPLCAALRQGDGTQALPLHLETSGVDPLSGRFDWITLSPKPHRPPTAELLAACDELKVVVSEPADLAFAEAMGQAARLGRLQQDRSQACRHSGDLASAEGPALLLQPAWDNPQGQDLALEHVRRHPHWRLSLQTHKWLQIR